jgi:hypothetical protein
MGKTPEEVRQVVGEPDSVQNFAGEPMWNYSRITTDPATGGIYSTTRVIFETGRVIRITFVP